MDNGFLPRPKGATPIIYHTAMFTSAADVFRTRQVVSDLTAFITTSGRSALGRISPDVDWTARLLHIVQVQAGRFRLPDDQGPYGAVLLAAALPDDDFPAFACATGLLLLDRVMSGQGDDSLFWNWEAFSDHVRMADPPIRAALMNAFRLAEVTGRVRLPCRPTDDDCLTRPAAVTLAALRSAGQTSLVRAIESGIASDSAGVLWLEHVPHRATGPVLAGLRHLYERPLSVVPADPATAPMIPWTL